MFKAIVLVTTFMFVTQTQATLPKVDSIELITEAQILQNVEDATKDTLNQIKVELTSTKSSRITPPSKLIKNNIFKVGSTSD